MKYLIIILILFLFIFYYNLILNKNNKEIHIINKKYNQLKKKLKNNKKLNIKIENILDNIEEQTNISDSLFTMNIGENNNSQDGQSFALFSEDL